MKTYSSFDEIISKFPIRKLPEKIKDKYLPIQKPSSEYLWDQLISECDGFKSLLELQRTKGVDYKTYINATIFFTQLKDYELAHRFASLHPIYGFNYDAASEGREATDRIINQYKDKPVDGYVTYEALGLTPCNHGGSSIVTHIKQLQNTSVSRFFKLSKNGKSQRFSTELAINEVNKKSDLVLFLDDERIYEYKHPIWVPLSDVGVKHKIHEIIGKDAEPTHIEQVFKKLQIQNQARFHIADTNEIIFKNGILKISSDTKLTTQFTPFSDDQNEVKERYLTSHINANYSNRRIKPKAFMTYLKSTFKGAEESIDIIQEIMGYIMLPSCPIHAWFLFYGPGGNGKGTLLHVIRNVIGHENVSELNLATFNRFSTATLQHKLVNITDELPTNGTAWELVKKLTGGGRIDAEIKNGPTFFFNSTSKFIVTTNEIPDFPDRSKGYWDRLNIIEFPNNFRGEENEKLQLHDAFHNELDAIACWALTGLIRLLKRKSFAKTERSQKFTEQAKVQSSSIESFLADRTVSNNKCGTCVEDLYIAYKAYCIASSYRPYTKAGFYRTLQELGLQKKREPSNASPRRFYFSGIGLVDSLFKKDMQLCTFYHETQGAPVKTCHIPEQFIKSEDACVQCPFLCEATDLPLSERPKNLKKYSREDKCHF